MSRIMFTYMFLGAGLTMVWCCVTAAAVGHRRGTLPCTWPPALAWLTAWTYCWPLEPTHSSQTRRNKQQQIVLLLLVTLT